MTSESPSPCRGNSQAQWTQHTEYVQHDARFASTLRLSVRGAQSADLIGCPRVPHTAEADNSSSCWGFVFFFSCSHRVVMRRGRGRINGRQPSSRCYSVPSSCKVSSVLVIFTIFIFCTTSSTFQHISQHLFPSHTHMSYPLLPTLLLSPIYHCPKSVVAV